MAKRKVVLRNVEPKKKDQVKDSASEIEDNASDEGVDDDGPEPEHDDDLPGITQEDLAVPPPPRACTLRTSPAPSPSKIKTEAASMSKRAKLEAVAANPVTLDILMLIVTKTYEIVRETRAAVHALQDKAQQNTRSIVDLTQLSNRVNELATAAETAAATVAVKDELKSRFAPVNIDDKIVLKFTANALSFITMWPKVDSPAWMPAKLEAFGKDIAGQPELDQVFFYIHISHCLIFFSAGPENPSEDAS